MDDSHYQKTAEKCAQSSSSESHNNRDNHGTSCLKWLTNFSAGTPEERGIRKLKRGAGLSAAELEGMRSYDLPFGMDFLRRHAIFKYLPISPTFAGYQWEKLHESCRGRMGHGGDGLKGAAKEEEAAASAVLGENSV